MMAAEERVMDLLLRNAEKKLSSSKGCSSKAPLEEEEGRARPREEDHCW